MATVVWRRLLAAVRREAGQVAVMGATWSSGPVATMWSKPTSAPGCAGGGVDAGG